MAEVNGFFKVYQGTLTAFKASALPTTYASNIVLIAGDASGKDSAIYANGKYYAATSEALNALKYFSTISAGGVTATAAGPNGTLNFSADDPASVSVKVDSTGVHFALTDAFKLLVNNAVQQSEVSTAGGANKIVKVNDKGVVTVDHINAGDIYTGKVTVDEHIRFNVYDEDWGHPDASGDKHFASTEHVEDVRAGLVGTDADTKDSNTIIGAKKYADDKLNIAIGGANEALIGSSSDTTEANTIWGAKNYGAQKAEDAKNAVIGASSDASTADTVYGAKKYAEEKADAAKSEAIADANTKYGGLEARIKDNEDAIGVLNGSGDGSVQKQVADAIAGVVASAPADFDTLKEIADYIASDKTGAAELSNRIAANEKAITETIPATYVKLENVTIETNSTDNTGDVVGRDEMGNIHVWDSIVFDDGYGTWVPDESGEGTHYFASLTQVNKAKDDVIGKDTDTATSDTVKGAKKYADSLAGNYATAAQGAKADTAVQEVDGFAQVMHGIRFDDTSDTWAPEGANGNASYHFASTEYVDGKAKDYATSAQGAKADSALQPAALEAYYTQSQVDAMFGFEVIS